MNKKIMKATTAVTLVTTVLAPVTPIICHAEELEKEQTKTVEEAKKALESAKGKNKQALAAQQAALDALNVANEEKEAATRKVEDAIAKAEEARKTAEALLQESKTQTSNSVSTLHTQYKEAVKAQETAKVNLSAQQKALEAQIALQEAANKKLEEAQANVTVTEQDVVEKQKALEEADTLCEKKRS